MSWAVFNNAVASRWPKKSNILTKSLSQQQRWTRVLVSPPATATATATTTALGSQADGTKRHSKHRLLLASKEIRRNPRASGRKEFFSTQGYTQGNRAFPAYNIFGETAVLTMKPILPKFKSAGQDGNIIDISQRGRMMIQFSPVSSSGVRWNDRISFALSAEELGLLISQIPHYHVTFDRELTNGPGGAGNGDRYDAISDDDSVMKTLTVTPIEGAAIHFEIDFMKNGVGGQLPPSNSVEANCQFAPMRVVVQAGEWEVMKSLAQESIPSLMGWRNLMNIALEDAVRNRER